jgi:hypothetical protein
VQEFRPDWYWIATAAYRWEPVFFLFLGLDATLARLERERRGDADTIEWEDAWLTALGARASTGFFGRSRLQLLYAHNFDVIRDGTPGGHALTIQVSKRF